MKRFESYGFVVVVCVLAMLPLNPLVFLFSFVAAIWSLVVLSNPTVRQAFEMRRLDECGADEIIAEPLPEHGLGAAMMDRLRRASV